MDTISLDGIEVWANHGVMEHEADLGQRYVVDVTIHLDLSAAAGSDDLADTVDYGALSSLVVHTFGAPRARLVEVVAGRVATEVLAHDERIEAVDVTVHKPSAPLTVPVRDVRITMHRTRRTNRTDGPHGTDGPNRTHGTREDLGDPPSGPTP